ESTPRCARTSAAASSDRTTRPYLIVVARNPGRVPDLPLHLAADGSTPARASVAARRLRRRGLGAVEEAVAEDDARSRAAEVLPQGARPAGASPARSAEQRR